jgi:hypothetical protein
MKEFFIGQKVRWVLKTSLAYDSSGVIIDKRPYRGGGWSYLIDWSPTPKWSGGLHWDERAENMILCENGLQRAVRRAKEL